MSERQQRATEDPRGSVVSWIGGGVETIIFLTCVLYLITNQLWALLLWETVAVLYLVVGGIIVWRGSRAQRATPQLARSVVRWLWIPPVMAAIVGANAAVTALITREAGTGAASNGVLIVAATLGIVLSWMLLHVGFADIYELTAAIGSEGTLRFPATENPSTLDFLYFSFTIGTSFATSDVEVEGVRQRRVVLVHSVVGFFYNALVVAVAFQVLQGLVSH